VHVLSIERRWTEPLRLPVERAKPLRTAAALEPMTAILHGIATDSGRSNGSSSALADLFLSISSFPPLLHLNREQRLFCLGYRLKSKQVVPETIEWVLRFGEHEVKFMHVVVKASRRRSGTLPNGAHRNDAQKQLDNLYTGLRRAGDRDEYALATFEFDLAKALPIVLCIGHDFSHLLLGAW
jgi:hypothetical protein